MRLSKLNGHLLQYAADHPLVQGDGDRRLPSSGPPCSVSWVFVVDNSMHSTIREIYEWCCLSSCERSGLHRLYLSAAHRL